MALPAPKGRLLNNQPQHVAAAPQQSNHEAPFAIIKSLIASCMALAMISAALLGFRAGSAKISEEAGASLSSRLKTTVSSAYEVDLAYLQSGYEKVRNSLVHGAAKPASQAAGKPRMIAAQKPVYSSDVRGVSVGARPSFSLTPINADRYTSSALLKRKLVQVIRGRGRRGVDPESLSQKIIAESAQAHFDPLFAAAVIKSESAFNRIAVSNAGARGLMQILPSTGAFIAGLEGFESVMKHKLTDPNYNVQLGIRYIQYLEQMYKGNRVLVLTAYNWGPGRVQDAIEGRRKIPAEVMTYALKILKDHQEWVNELLVAA